MMQWGIQQSLSKTDFGNNYQQNKTHKNSTVYLLFHSAIPFLEIILKMHLYN